MNVRTRKLLGIFANVIWLTVYALVAMALGGQFVVGHGMAVELPYYVLAGVAWLPVSMWLIRWMSRPDPTG
jgi:hypothetical protein